MNEHEISILVIDDDDVDVMNVERAFQKNKIRNRLLIAETGLDALTMLREGTGPMPRIILLDINMPKMSGIEFLIELRKDPILHSISVFVMTTSAEDSDILAAYNLNVAGYIVKPLSFEAFAETIKTLDCYWKLCMQPKE